jgi:hypothetical protein
MDSRDLTPDQFEIIQESVKTWLRYLQSLDDRMKAKEFPDDDPLVKFTRYTMASITLFNERLDFFRRGVDWINLPGVEIPDRSWIIV